MAELTPEQIEAQKKEAAAAAEKEAKANTPKKDGKFVSLQSIYDGYAKKATAKTPHEVDIVKNYPVEFTKDFLNIPKGHKQSVSKVMLDWYTANDAVKELKVD